ncbi:MAG TPA: DNA polymerase III subunit delta' [Rhodospirillaceae bacterium]|nr:DNA polymerase III subunit delta' [Rhodospirillaceae bacterium]
MPLEIASPHQTLAVIGHDDAKRQLAEAFDSGRMHHAWLLTGAEGIGKTSLAYLVAHMILSGGENRFDRLNPEHPAARLIAAQAHPDLFVLRCPVDEKTGAVKDTIPVDEARKLAPFLSMTASQGAGRVAIIDEAHKLNRHGQNAILKMIEEPPTGATILLTATTVGGLLPTIRSRCRVLPMQTLSDSQLEVVLARLGVEVPEGADKARFFMAAAGSVGRALKLIEADALPLFDELLSILAAMPMLDLLRVQKLADQIGKKADADSFQVVTGLLIDTLRQSIRVAALGQADPTGLASKIGGRARLDKALELWESTGQTFAVAEGGNLDKKLVFINALSTISRMTA